MHIGCSAVDPCELQGAGSPPHAQGCGYMREYRKLAEECLEVALKIKEQQHRCAFLDLASELLERAGNGSKTSMLRAEVEAMKRPAN